MVSTKSKGELLKTLLYTSVITFGSFFLPSNSNPIDLTLKEVKYFDYSLTSQTLLETLAKDSSYPGRIDLCYEIPENEQGLTGTLKLQRDSSGARIEIDFDHSKESKLISFLRQGTFYSELDENRKNNKKYLDTNFVPTEKTIIDLVEAFILNKEYSPEKVEFKHKEYKLNIERIELKEGFVLRGQIKNNKPMVTEIEVYCQERNKKIIPVEINLIYRIKIKKLFFNLGNPIKIKGILQGYNLD